MLPKIVQDIVQAYKITKLKPVTGTFLRAGQACGIGALITSLPQNKRLKLNNKMISDLADNLLGDSYVDGFILGFDLDREYRYTSLKQIRSKFNFLTERQQLGIWHGYLTAKKIKPTEYIS